LILISGINNPADGPSHCPDYMQDISISTGSLIPPNPLHLLSSDFINALFASIVRVHAIDIPKLTMQEQILSSYLTNAVAS